MEGGTKMIYKNVHFSIKIVSTKHPVSSGMWGLVIALVLYGSNNCGLRVYEMMDCTVCHSDLNHFPQRVLLAIHQFSEPKL